MAFEADFLEFMTQSIDVEQPDGTFTDRGKPNFGAPISIQCRIVLKNEIVRAFDGQERFSKARIYMDTTTIITPESKLTLPVGFTPLNPPILAIDREPDEEGDHHTVLRI